MRIYKGVSASPGLVVGQVSRLGRHAETFENRRSIPTGSSRC